MEFDDVPGVVGSVFWMIKIIDLKKERFFIPQYVELRNSYVDLLLTNLVTVNETKDWLINENAEVKCLIDNDVLIGVAILYLNKKGEITFFVKYPGRGIGHKMINIIEKVAKENDLNSVWAWVLKNNLIAQRVFEKNGFLIDGIKERKYKDVIKQGIEYKKYLNY